MRLRLPRSLPHIPLPGREDQRGHIEDIPYPPPPPRPPDAGPVAQPPLRRHHVVVEQHSVNTDTENRRLKRRVKKAELILQDMVDWFNEHDGKAEDFGRLFFVAHAQDFLETPEQDYEE